MAEGFPGSVHVTAMSNGTVEVCFRFDDESIGTYLSPADSLQLVAHLVDAVKELLTYQANLEKKTQNIHHEGGHA